MIDQCKSKYLIYLFLVLTALPACSQMSYDEKLAQLYKYTVPLIKPEPLQQLLQSDKSVYLLDTRKADEYRVSHIKEARLINYDHFNIAQVKDIPREATIIVYCSVGYRSERIGEKLQEHGYKDVRNLYGGIFEWKNSGMTVVDGAGNTTDSVHTYNRKWSKWLEKGVKVY